MKYKKFEIYDHIQRFWYEVNILAFEHTYFWREFDFIHLNRKRKIVYCFWTVIIIMVLFSNITPITLDSR